MELNLQPLATSSSLSGRPFAEGDRVISALVRTRLDEVARYDLHADEEAGFSPEGFVACRWVHRYKPRNAAGDPERALKLGAESLFLELTDPATESTPESGRMIQFLALLLERKKVLKPRGRNPDGTRLVYEHSRSKQRFEVAAGEMAPEFFLAVREQLSVLVGEPKGAPRPEAGAQPMSTPHPS